MEEELLKVIVSEFTKTLLENSKSVFLDIKDQYKSFIGTGVKKYLEKKRDKFAYTKTLFYRIYPVYFYTIYQPAKLIYRDNVIETYDIQNVFRETRFVTVIGDAGSGKSMLVTHLFLNSIKEKFSIPLIIELRNLNDYVGDIGKYIRDKIFDNKLSPNEVILERMLASGAFTFFLDGYDEIKSDLKRKVVENLNSFIDKYNDNFFLLTSRPYSNVELLPLFHNYLIRKLTSSEIDQFILKQQIEPELAKNIINSVKESKVEYIKSFLTNPLLLSLYILTFSYNSTIPNKKFIFYRRVLDVLFKEHDSITKVGYEREILTDLSQEQFEEVLKMFCFITYFEDEYDFEKDSLIAKLNYIKDRPGNIKFENNKFITDLKNAIALWVEDSGVISFAHRSLQEYFAALYIQNMIKGKRELYKKIQMKLFSFTRRSESSNFLSLCEEMDAYNYGKYLLLPALRYIKKALNKDNFISKIRAAFELFVSILNFNIENGDLNISSIQHNAKYYKYTFCVEEYGVQIAEWFFVNENTKLLLPTFSIFEKSNGNTRPQGAFKPFDLGYLKQSDLEILQNTSLVDIINALELEIDERIEQLNNYLKNKEQSEKDFIDFI